MFTVCLSLLLLRDRLLSQVVCKERQHLNVTQSAELCTTLAGACALLVV